MNPSTIPVAGANTADSAQFGNYSDWAQGEMAKGFTPDQLHATLQQHGIAVAQPQAAAQPTAQPSGGGESWWKKLLPAAGGVLGGILGGAADVASLGLAAPLINPITGAALGGAGGQAAENALTGKKVLQGSDITSGLENAAGEAVGLEAGKLVKGLGEGLAGAAGKMEGKAATEATAADAAKQDLMKNYKTDLNFGDIPKKVRIDQQLGSNQKLMEAQGLDSTDPYAMQKFSQSGLEVNGKLDQALQGTPDIKLPDLGKEVVNFGKSAGIDPTQLGTTRLGQAFTEANVPLDANNLSAVQLRALRQSVNGQYRELSTRIGYAEHMGNPQAAMQLEKEAKPLKSFQDYLDTKLNTPEVNKAISKIKLSPSEEQQLISKYGKQQGENLISQINGMQNYSDATKIMRPYAQMSDLSKSAIDNIENDTASKRAMARTKFAQTGEIPGNAGAGAEGATPLDVAEAGASAIHKPTALLIKAANRAHKAGLTPKILKGVGGAMRRTAPLVAPAATVSSNIPNIAAASQPGAAGSVIPSTAGGGAMQPSATGAGAPVNPVNQTVDSLLWSLQQPGASLTPGYGSMVSGLQALAPTSLGNELAAGTAGALAPTYAGAGGAQGLGGGLVSELLSKVPGTAQNTYARQQLATATQLAKILGITPEAAMAMLPQFTQTPGVAAPQQAATGSLVGTLTAGLPAQ